jgi:leucyl-tRNA synthetase
LFATIAGVMRKHHRQLDASVGASGPHGFAVRIRAVRYRHIRVHRIPPRVRDDREPPLQWDETVKVMQVIWVGSEGRIFLTKGLDRIC